MPIPRGRFQQYDVSADVEINIGDIRIMADGSEWVVYDCVGCMVSADNQTDASITRYRITIIPNTPANRAKIARMEQEL